MKNISRAELQKKLDRGDELAVVEVLAKEKFQEFHLPGAINVPLDEQFDEQIQRQVPDKNKPVVVYCWDADCNASPKAAERMEALGYKEVYDYEAGKKDWKDAGLSVVGA